MRYMRKKSLLIIGCCIAFLLSGCSVYPVDYRTDCYVYLTGGSDHEDEYMCSRDEEYYYCLEDKGIYKYTCGASPELLVPISDAEVVKLACTDGMLYYSVKLLISNGEESDNYTLYSYSLTDSRETEMAIEMEESCVLIGTHGQDVFWETTENEIPVLYCFHDTEYEMVDISNGIEELSYRDYILRKDEDGWITNIRCTTDGWQNSISELYMDGSYFSLDTAKDYTGDAKDLSRTVQGNHGATWYSMMEEEKGRVYALYQYGRATQIGKINPVFKADKDTIYSFDVENKSIECFYFPDEKDEQIVDYSIENGYMYLLRNDGLYQCNLQGGEQRYILDEDIYGHIFVDLDGILFWFDWGLDQAEELVAVIRADTGEIIYRK